MHSFTLRSMLTITYALASRHFFSQAQFNELAGGKKTHIKIMNGWHEKLALKRNWTNLAGLGYVGSNPGVSEASGA